MCQESIGCDDILGLVLKKCHDIVFYYHKRTKAIAKLIKGQKITKLPQQKLVKDISTRLNSTFYMLKRLIEQNICVTTTLCFMGKSDIVLSEDDVKSMTAAVKLLHPFKRN